MCVLAAFSVLVFGDSVSEVICLAHVIRTVVASKDVDKEWLVQKHSPKVKKVESFGVTPSSGNFVASTFLRERLLYRLKMHGVDFSHSS